ncbi:MAG: putative transport system permease protein [Thermoanaerobaculia bacterium]|jgi:putative ABC transport system permease protein|nr:putative transport system permease protein [Thermoanaerobaculia bacterium]
MILRALILRPILREPMRTVLTILGIAVGVAVVVAIALSNQSALRAFSESVDAVAGRANYQIVSDAGLSEDVLRALQPFWPQGVRFAPVIDAEGVVDLPSERRRPGGWPGGVSPPTEQIPVRLLGVDLLSDLHFRDYRYASVVTSNQESAATYLSLFSNDSVVVPASFAREHALRLGSPLVLNIQGVRRTMIVRGLLEAHGPATAFNGAIVIADIAVVQPAFGLEGKLTRIDLIVPDESLVAPIMRVIPASARLERPARRNQRVEKMLRAFRVNLFALAGVALLVGMFLVYNTVLISILRRRKDVGVLKTLGTSATQIFGAFILEGLAFGVVGSIAGVALGRGLAWMILKLIGQTVNALYVSSAPQAIELTPAIVAAGVAVGTILSLLSAIQPSIEAAQVRPGLLLSGVVRRSYSFAQPSHPPSAPFGSLRSLRAGSSPPQEAWGRKALDGEDARERWTGREAAREKTTAHGTHTTQIVIAIVCFIVAALLSRLPAWNGIAVAGYAAVLFVVAGFSALAALIVTSASRLLRAPYRAAFGIVGELASASIPASLRRTSIAAAALSLAIGMMVAVALMVGSFRETVRVWVDQTVSSDLWLRPSKGLSNADSSAFPNAISNDLANVPFVAAFDRARARGVLYGDAVVTLASGDFAVAARYGDLPMIAPRKSSEALQNAIAKSGVVVSESLSLKYEKGVGDEIALTTIHGRRSFPITGVYRDYSNDRGVVAMDRALYVRSYDDDAINTIVVYLKPGIDRDTARRNLESILGPKYHAFAVTNGEIRGEVMRIFDQTFLITYALLAVAIVVAVLGVINTLAALILERKRELALLRVLGMTIAQVRRMLVLESSVLGLTSTAAGLAMGYVLSWILIYVINKQSFGWTIAFHTPVRLIAASLAVTFVASLVAGLVPSRLARRIDLAMAMKAE